MKLGSGKKLMKFPELSKSSSKNETIIFKVDERVFIFRQQSSLIGVDRFLIQELRNGKLEIPDKLKGFETYNSFLDDEYIIQLNSQPRRQ